MPDNYGDCHDERLVVMTLNGDTEAYSEIVNRYKNLVFNVTMSIVRNYHMAEDIAQESFIDGYLKLKSLTDKSKISSWLCRISKNVGLVKASFDSNNTIETYELYEYRLNGGSSYFPMCVGNLWRYSLNGLPDYYYGFFEREIISFDGEYANFSAINIILLQSAHKSMKTTLVPDY